jgi:SAM-dependent methyltransferase
MIDFGLTATDYARHRAGFPDALFDRLSAHQVGLPGQRVLDLGTGTGSLARGLARRGGVCTGIDKALPLLDAARRLDAEAHVEVAYRVGAAEATGLADGAFDVVSAGQCWHWFDRPRAAAEAHRLLAPGGRLLIAHFDWLPLAGNVVEATERLIVAHNPGWAFGGGTGMYPQWLTDAANAGFRGIETFSFDVEVPYSHQGWRGRIRASAGVSASLRPDAVERFDTEHAALLRSDFPQDPLLVPHRIFALIALRAPDAVHRGPSPIGSPAR